MSNFANSVFSTATVTANASSATVVRKYYFGTQLSGLSNVSLQLTTEAHNQGWASEPDRGIWTWFELAILSNAPSTGDDATPYIRKGSSGELLTWKSHDVPLKKEWNTQSGPTFTSDSPLIQNLQPNNVVGVIACAQYPAWSLDARQGILSVSASTN